MRKLFVLFIISILPLSAFADAVQIGSLWYNLDESAKTAEVTSAIGDGYSGDIVIPATVTYSDVAYNVTCIGSYAFSYSSISSIVIPEGVDSIGNYAFYSCRDLTSVTFPTSTLRIIEDHGFYDCYSLTNIIIPEGVTRIGEWAFGYNNNNWVGVAKVKLPSTITSIGNYAFCGIRNFSSVVSRIASPFEIDRSVFCSDYYWEGEDYVYTPSSATLCVPDDTKAKYEAFSGWKMFAEIVEGELLEAKVDSFTYSYIKGKGAATLIGHAYSETRNITIPGSVKIGDDSYTVKKIGAGVFQNYNNLDTLVIESGVETIGEWAFGNNPYLHSVQLPTSLKVIGKNAFYDCQIDSLVVPEGVETIEDRAFYDSDRIYKLDLPSTLKTIGEEAFTWAYISTLVLPEGLASIGKNAFYHCSSLNKLELPSTLDSIADYAFRSCDNLSMVVSRIQTPFEISQNVFGKEESSIWDEEQQKDVYTYTKSKATLYVPDGKKTSYEAFPGWNMFANIIEGELLEATVDSLTYSYLKGKGTATLIGHTYSETRTITIPGSVPINGESYTVKEIGASAFQSYGNLDTLVVESGVVTIGESAFRDTYLRKVTFPNSLKTIGKEAFCYCSIDTLVIPEGVDSIAEGAFRYHWSSMQSVSLPTTLRTIGREAFMYCTGLNSLVIPQGMKTIGESAFYECYGIRRLELPSTVDSVGTYAFWRCNNLSTVVSKIQAPFNINENVFAIGSNGSYDDSGNWVNTYTPSSATLYVPDKTKSAYEAKTGWNMFANIIEGELLEATVDSLTYTYLKGKGTATLIGHTYSETRNVTIPGSVPINGETYVIKEIGASAFQNYGNLDTLVVESGVVTIGESAFSNNYNLHSVKLPTSLKTIGKNAFNDCRIDTLVVPEGVDSIAEGAFRYQNERLRSVTLPTSLRTIGREAFMYCTGLNSLVIPQGMKTIGESAFYECYGIRRLELPSTVDSVGTYAFWRCNNLSTVVSKIQAPFNINENVFAIGSNGSYDDSGNWVNTYTPSSATLYVPDKTKSAYEAKTGWNMFANIIEGELLEATVDSLTYTYLKGKGTATLIGHTYSETRNVTIPGSVPINGETYVIKEIGASAFQNYGNLDTLVVESGVVTIGESAFSNNYNLHSVKLPTSLKTIGKNAFYNCQIDTLAVPEGVETIDDRAFWDSDGINELVLPSTLKSIGEEAFTYAYFSNLVLPEGLVSIGRNAFSQCYRLNKLELPSTLDSIADYAFRDCNNLKIVTSRIKTPFNISQNVFGRNERWSWDETEQKDVYSYDPSNATLYVPEGTSEKYKAIKGWTMFADIVEGELLEATVDSLTYTYLKNKDKATVVGHLYKETRNITIPGSVKIGDKTFTVNEIGASAFQSYGNLDTLVINTGVETIGESAFSNNYNLRSVTFPTSLKTIGKNSFNDCRIDTLAVPEGVETIMEGAFRYQWSNLKAITLPTTLKTIEREAFYYCQGFASLIIPEGVSTIGESAFRNCNALSKLELASSLTAIGERAFANNSNLSSVTSRIQTPFDISESVFCIGENSTWVDSLGTNVYSYTPSNANLYVPEGTSEKYKAIKGWTMFAGIYEGELQEKVVGDFKYAYLPNSGEATLIASDYSQLKNITIPGSIVADDVTYTVKEIGNGAFRNCSNLDTVKISNGVEIIGKNAFQYCYYIKVDTLPSSLRTINDYAFDNCHNLKIAFSEGLETIGQSAFSYCHNLQDIAFPSTLKSIGDRAFYYCNRIAKLILPEGLETIGQSAFQECYNMQKVTLPSTLKSIGETAFRSTSSLSVVTSHIKVPFEISPNVFGSEDEYDYDQDKWKYRPCSATLFVPEGTMDAYKKFEGWLMFADMYEGELKEEKVGDLMYSYNTSTKIATVMRDDSYSKLGDVEVPTTVTFSDEITCSVGVISPRAFYGTPITSVVFKGDENGGVTTISQEAFQECSKLQNVTLPSTLTIIEDAVFRNCSRLVSIAIPDSVKAIGEYVFSNCTALSSIEVGQSNKVYESGGSNAIIESKTKTLLYGCKNTVIPSGVTVIGREAFFNSGLTEIEIPGTVRKIENNAFGSCHNLTDVYIPEGVDTLEVSAFSNCDKLATVELPNSLSVIEDWVFGGCNNLRIFATNITDPKPISTSVFGDNSEIFSRAVLWVPRGKKETYMATEGWNQFANYDELLRDTLPKPSVTYNGRYLVLSIPQEYRASIYYSTDESTPTILYSDSLIISNIGQIQAIAKRYGSYTVDTTKYEIPYVYDGVTARTARGGLLAKAFEWSGTSNIESLDIAGTLNDDDFGTIRGLSKLAVLNMSASKMESGSLPAQAFANTSLQWYISPSTLTGVGSNIFKGCKQLTAITWNTSTVEMPEDVVADVDNPNMLVYAKAQAMIPYAIKNVIVNGIANNIVLADSAGNNNFNCPVEFTARRISYTHDYQQPTAIGVSQGWETIALPFNVDKITHERNGELTPIAVDGADKPFWLYELGTDSLVAATQIRANVPYLICMPNNDEYGDEYILGGRVTFSAKNVVITTSSGNAVSLGNRTFVPTYQRVDKSDNVYALNVGEAYGDSPAGSVFVANYREVRPFEAYSVHTNNASRIISVSSLGGGDATGIKDILSTDGDAADSTMVKVYSLSGTLIKQGPRNEVLRGLPRGLYIINGKKIFK